MALVGTLGLVLGARDAAALCVAGVAQADIHFPFFRGRRGAISHPLSFCVAGVALMVRFHIFHCQILRDISHESFVFTSPTFTF